MEAVIVEAIGEVWRHCMQSIVPGVLVPTASWRHRPREVGYGVKSRLRHRVLLDVSVATTNTRVRRRPDPVQKYHPGASSSRFFSFLPFVSATAALQTGGLLSVQPPVSPVTILVVSQQQRWMRQMPVLSYVSLLPGSRRKRQEPPNGSTRRQLTSRPVAHFASISKTERQNRDIRQRDTPLTVTSFVATLVPYFLQYLNWTRNTPVGDALQTPYTRLIILVRCSVRGRVYGDWLKKRRSTEETH